MHKGHQRSASENSKQLVDDRDDGDKKDEFRHLIASGSVQSQLLRGYCCSGGGVGDKVKENMFTSTDR